MQVMKINEVFDFIDRLGGPDSEKAGLYYGAALVSVKGQARLGFTIDVLGCCFCGREHQSIHPIPMYYPAVCVGCGRIGCYVK